MHCAVLFAVAELLVFCVSLCIIIVWSFDHKVVIKPLDLTCVEENSSTLSPPGDAYAYCRPQKDFTTVKYIRYKTYYLYLLL